MHSTQARATSQHIQLLHVESYCINTTQAQAIYNQGRCKRDSHTEGVCKTLQNASPCVAIILVKSDAAASTQLCRNQSVLCRCMVSLSYCCPRHTHTHTPMIMLASAGSNLYTTHRPSVCAVVLERLVHIHTHTHTAQRTANTATAAQRLHPRL